MKVLEPGHAYELTALDGDEPVIIRFVNRESNPHSGTQTQEVLRANIDSLEVLIDRTNHCDACLPWAGNERIIKALSEAQRQLRLALLYHEERAFERKIEKDGFQPEHVSTGDDGHFALLEGSYRRKWSCPMCFIWLTNLSDAQAQAHVSECWAQRHIPHWKKPPGPPVPVQKTMPPLTDDQAHRIKNIVGSAMTDAGMPAEVLGLRDGSEFKCLQVGCGYVGVGLTHEQMADHVAAHGQNVIVLKTGVDVDEQEVQDETTVDGPAS